MAYSKVFTVLLLATIIAVALAKPGYLGGYRYGGYYPYAYSYGYPSYYGYGHGHGLYGGYGYGHGFGHGLGYYGHYY